MFSKIPEMSLNSNQTSSQSASLTRSQATGKVSSQRGKSGTDPQRKPGTEQQIKPGTDQANSVGQKDLPKGPLKEEDQNTSKPTKSSLTPNPGSSSKASGTKPKTSFKETSQVSSSIVEEIDANVNRVPVSGLDGALVQARRYSITSTGRVKSPDPSAAATKATSVKVDQSPRRFSITSLPSAEQQHSRRSSISKAASAVTTNDPFRRSISIASSHSAERRFSASSPRSLTEVGQEEARRIGMESNQQRRRSSRETRRRASLILVGSNYRVGRKIGAGNFGEIRMGKNLTTDEVVAIKLEPMSARFSQLRREYIFYKKLSQSSAVEGIPSVYFWSTCLSYNALVMELLGPNLAELFELCNQKFTLKTVVLIALQTIRRIQFVHSKSILYRDVKPENFVIGRLKSKRQVIYLLDFGLAKEYIDPDTREHIPLKENKGITGTARYISINMHQGKEMSRRDDLEALGYMLLYFLKGRLPWQGQHLKFGNDMDTLNAVSNIKIHTSVEQLCQGYPSEFSVYLTYVRGLGFFDSPDYDFLSKLFQSLLEKMDIPCDWIFDWMKQELVVTPSGMLLTRLTDGNKIDGVDEPFVDRASAGEGGRFQSNKAMMSYDNLMMRDLSLNMSANKEAIFEGQSPELHTYDTRKDKTGLSLISFPTKCIFCSCCGVCCIHKTNRISPI